MDVTLLGILAGAVATLVVLTVAYYVVRFAVRDGIIDAQARIDADRVRSEMRLRPERSPSSRSWSPGTGTQPS